MTRDDLKTGMVLEFANGTKGLVMDSIYGQCVYYAKHNELSEWDRLSIFTDDLKHYRHRDLNIVKILRVPELESSGFCLRPNRMIDTINNSNSILWEREEPVVEMTMEQVCEALGKNIKIVKDKK